MKNLRDFFVNDMFYEEEMSTFDLFHTWLNLASKKNYNIPDGIMKLHQYYESRFNKDSNEEDEKTNLTSSSVFLEKECKIEQQQKIINQFFIRQKSLIQQRIEPIQQKPIFKPAYRKFAEQVKGDISNCLGTIEY